MADNQIRVEVVADSDKAVEAVEKFDKAVAHTITKLKTIGNITKSTTTSFNSMGEKIKTTSREIENSTRRINFNFLGIMFFGMQIQRTFSNIAKNATSAFMKITEGQTRQGMALTALSAEWQFFQFTVGNAIATALEPFLPTIINIIDRITDWIDRNPQLFGTIILVAGGLGALLFYIGSVTIGIQSLLAVIGAGTAGGAGGTGLVGSLGATEGAALTAGAAMAGAGIIIADKWERLPAIFQTVKDALNFDVSTEKITNNFLKLGFTIATELISSAIFAITWLERIKTIFSDFANTIIDFFSNLVVKIIDKVISMIPGLKGAVKGIFAAIGISPQQAVSTGGKLGAAATIPGAALPIIEDMFRQFFEPMKNLDIARNQLTNLPNTLTQNQSIQPQQSVNSTNTSFNGGINVTVNTTGTDVDIKKLAQQISEELDSEIRKKVNPMGTKFTGG